jgi:hypothetical protein
VISITYGSTVIEKPGTDPNGKALFEPQAKQSPGAMSFRLRKGKAGTGAKKKTTIGFYLTKKVL